MPLPIGAAVPIARGVGSALGGAFAKRKRSSCRTVSVEDREGFLSGSVSPWVVWDRVDDIAVAWGLHSGLGYAHDSIRQTVLHGGSSAIGPIVGVGSYRAVAEMHLNVFVPLCESLEGGEAGYTDDPNAGKGLETYNRARLAFQDHVKRGGSMAHAEGDSGNLGAGELIPGPRDAQGAPRRAGLDPGGGMGLGIVLVAGLGLLLLSRG